MKFKRLRVKTDGDDIVLDGYSLTSEISDYSKTVVKENQIAVQVFNPNIGAIFNRETFERVMASDDDFDAEFGVRLHPRNPNYTEHEDVYWFKPKDVIDWELF